jgi:all-trans-8'-apo-beta-carotenal 15,15'-oxygenase
VPAPAGFVFHHLNAFEDTATGEVVVDSIYYEDFPSIGPEVDFREIDFASIPEGQLRRCRIDPRSGTVQSEWLEQRCCEFAMVNPARQGLQPRFAWMAVAERERGNDPLQAIEKLDLHTGERRVWSAAPRGFVSEPVMVPSPNSAASEDQAAEERADEDSGWVLVPVWNGARCATDLVILNAVDMSEQAVLELPLAIPYGLHGTWAQA